MNKQPQPAVPVAARPIGRGVFLGVTGITAASLGLSAAGVKVPNPFGGFFNELSTLLPGHNVNGFTIYTIADFPTMAASHYRLTIDGLVDHPRTYTLAELRAKPRIDETRYYQCVTGWQVPRPKWSGVRLADLIRAAAPTSKAKALHFSCFDGAYTESLTLDQAARSDVLLAYGLDGKLLSRDQGYPIRLVVPGMYGYKFAKWVNRITVTDHVIPGYWEQNGYDVDAWIGRSNGY